MFYRTVDLTDFDDNKYNQVLERQTKVSPRKRKKKQGRIRTRATSVDSRILIIAIKTQ